MMRAAVDRSRPTKGGMVGSTLVHLALLALLTLALRPQVAVEMAQELTKISYIEAHLGENVAEKVRLKTLAKRTPPSLDPGRGISTRSAQKSPATPEPKTPSVEREPRRTVADVEPDLPRPTRREQPKLDEAPRLEARDADLARVDLPTSRARDDRGAVEADGPELVQRSSTAPTLETGGPELRSRDGALSVVGGDIDPTPRGAARREVADADQGALPRGGNLQSSRPGGGYKAPGASLQSSRSGSRGLAEAGGDAIAPPANQGSESGGRRTILDYGSGGGGGGLRSRGGGIAPAPDRPTEPSRSQASDRGPVDTAPVEIENDGMGMSITGQIAGRKILHVVSPEYSAQARRQGWEGVVAVHFTVLPDGRVKDNTWVKQMAQHRDLNRAAMEAIREFRFAPLPTGEAQVEQWGVITFVFRLK